MLISVAVPNGLMNVSNGQSRGKELLPDGYTRWDWFVGNPINNYDVSVNIAAYAHFTDTYEGHTLNYYVLPEHLEKAKEQFGEVPLMLACFEKRFGSYPFWEDGYKLVETPYLGMEHQSAVAYGNEYKMGYRRSEEHTSELQSLMRISYAVFCLNQKNTTIHTHN